MTQTDKYLFIGLQVVAWIIFVGLSIDSGGLIVNFIFSVFKPEMVGNLYNKLDLSQMYLQNKWAFFGTYGFVLFISILKAMLFYTVIEMLQKLDLSKPFSTFVSRKIVSIAYYTFSIGIISHIARHVVKSLQHYGYEIDKLGQYWVDSSAFIIMAAIIYIISVIFKRGIEIQEENDLTV